MVNFVDGVVRTGSFKGMGEPLCNVVDGVVKTGAWKEMGQGLFNVLDGVAREGTMKGLGTSLGKVNKFAIKGMEKELDAEMVAAYHFFVKKIV